MNEAVASFRNRVAPARMTGGIFCYLICLAGLLPAAEPRLEWHPPGERFARGAVTVAVGDRTGNGWDAQELSRRLEVRLVSAARVPPVLGTHWIRDGRLGFEPEFPLAEGVEYEAIFHADAANQNVPPRRLRFRLTPAVTASASGVPVIHPTASVLPANHLKFYVIFPEPMARGGIFRHLALLDERNQQVPEPFRETELWSADGRRLTLWFHPGRQKTGVNLNVEIGPVLRSGTRYRLLISRHWETARGVPLGRDVPKEFLATEPDRIRPDPAAWRLAVPLAETRDPLRVSFPEPLDWALLQRELQPRSAGGDAVPGSVTILDGETAWEFTPARPWSPGRYELVVGPRLEDLAGNSPGRLFERDVSSTVGSPAGAIRLPFVVRGGE